MSGYVGQVSINTACRRAGRRYLKNKLLFLAEYGPILWYVVNRTEPTV